MAKDTDRMARAMTYSAISRDFQLITLTSVIANLVTLYVISIGTEAKLATSVVIISILVFALLSGINQMDTFKNCCFSRSNSCFSFRYQHDEPSSGHGVGPDPR